MVRTAANPQFHWGNFVLVTDPGTVDDPDRWRGVFAENFPDADWVAIGLPVRPSEAAAWERAGLPLQDLDVLVTGSRPVATSCPAGHVVRPFGPGDWERDLARGMAENAASGRHDPAAFEAFVTAQSEQRRDLVARGLAVWFGAFSGDRLVADLGIVRCGNRARYQDVSTDVDFRRRGLASHLLGVAGEWARSQGCTEWVIVTETESDAGRVYRRAGFRPSAGGTEAYQEPS